MARSYHISEAIWFFIERYDREVHICPECVDHEFGQEASQYLDCKNTFTDDSGQNIGQCMCYSIQHGKR